MTSYTESSGVWDINNWDVMYWDVLEETTPEPDEEETVTESRIFNRLIKRIERARV